MRYEISGPVLISLASVALVGLLMTLGYWRLVRRLGLMRAMLEQIAREMAALQSPIAGNGASVVALASHFEKLSTQLRVLEQYGSTATGVQGNVGSAIRRARQGASEADLVADFGLSGQEASLIWRLHGAQSSIDKRRAVS